MDFTGIVIATLVLGITGLVVGIILGIAGKAFAVKIDEKEIRIRELLPGNNCGGCGFAGCDALAKAIANGEAAPDTCPVAGTERGKEIAAVLGIEAENRARKVMFVTCAGTCEKTSVKYNYYGEPDCRKLALIPGQGQKACEYGCMGYGSCVSACSFDAIHIVNGVAKVDPEACKACGMCVKVCPRNLIISIPYEGTKTVACHSEAAGKAVKAVCETGCIGCGICAKQCEAGAITITNHLASIDPSKCTGCGKCAEKCPVHIIR